MRVPLYQVDAFTDRLFGGNPAAVCPLPHWLDDGVLQAIAAENNLSETAFLVRRTEPAGHEAYDLRWFTPEMEVDLCGHATLAASFVHFERLCATIPAADSTVEFHTRSGRLGVTRTGGRLEMDFPSQPGEPLDITSTMRAALGGAPLEARRSVHYDLFVYASEGEVRELAPDATRLLDLGCLGVIATARGAEGSGIDFVSRFFAPKAGIYEDPVTGSAHCVSTPYWAEELGRSRLRARQISKRVGDLACELRGDRVAIAGEARLYLEGEIEVPDAIVARAR